MEFKELSDKEWNFIKHFLPPKSKVGRPRANDRIVINGILYVLFTGCRWMNMLLKYGFNEAISKVIVGYNFPLVVFINSSISCFLIVTASNCF